MTVLVDFDMPEGQIAIDYEGKEIARIVNIGQPSPDEHLTAHHLCVHGTIAAECQKCESRDETTRQDQ